MRAFATRRGRRRNPAAVPILVAISAGASLFSAGAAAAADVTGRITDPGGNPVPNATVRLDPIPGEVDVLSRPDGSDAHVATSSHTSGRYVLRGVMPGKYRLSCGGASSRDIYVGLGVHQEHCTQHPESVK